MGERFTVQFDDENADWIDTEADERDRSKAWVVNEALRAARGEPSTYGVNSGEDFTGEVNASPQGGELEEVVDRLEAIEGALGRGQGSENTPMLSDSESGAESESRGNMTNTPRKSPREQGPAPQAEGRDVDADTLLDDYRAWLEAGDKPPKTIHGRGAVVDALRYLRENGKSDTSEVQDAVYPDYTDYWTGARTMWNSIDRYLKELPGFVHGYGSWDYAGDDEIRDALGEHTDDR